MSVPDNTIEYQINADTWPKGWTELTREWGFRRSKRSTAEFPIWFEVTGRGYSVWLSEVTLIDSSASPPRWAAKMESLSALSDQGLEMWDDIHKSFCDFFGDEDIDYICV